MAKKRRAGRPPGSKNKSKTGKRRGRIATSIADGTRGGFTIQIENLQAEKKRLQSSIKTIDKAIKLLSRFT